MQRALVLIYGLLAYAVALATLAYLVGFVAGVGVPKTIDDGPEASLLRAIAVDLALIALFGVQHSVMARPGFKARLTRWVPRPAERPTYVALASAALIVLFLGWHPIGAMLWSVDAPLAAGALYAVAALGWLMVVSSTFLIDHFELFGLRQVAAHFRDRPMPRPEFVTPLLYRVVRHPLNLGFLLAFWATPTMTAGHALFAVAMTVYIVLAMRYEERDLIAAFGDAYRRYRQEVPQVIPFLK